MNGARTSTATFQLVTGIVAVVIGTWAVYVQSSGFDFINVDDPHYVQRNIRVHEGLTWSNARWALMALDIANWHPLTWISYFVDAERAGIDPGAFHVTNTLLHALGSVLLIWALFRLTEVVWASVTIGALFALHPVHVESVAWIAERKDVLCGAFWTGTLVAYSAYVRRPGAGRYMAAFLLFLCALMAKSMAVTLPVVLLLLDFWPLGRASPSKPWQSLLAEKIPFFVASAAVSIVAIVAQSRGGGLRTVSEFGLLERLGNAVVAYVAYAGKLFWPADLAAYYPVPLDGYPLWQYAVCSAALATVTILSVAFARRLPYLFVGWAWYVVTLLPVIGVIQVGGQAMADRYTYLPSIGVFIAVVYGMHALLGDSVAARQFKWMATAGISLILASLAWAQTGYWRDSVSLWRHVIAVTGPNSFAQAQLGQALSDRGELDSARTHLEEALRISPRFRFALRNLGHVHYALDEFETALEFYGRALAGTSREREPRIYANTNASVGVALLQLGRLDLAEEALTAALEADPDHGDALVNLGSIHVVRGQPDRAITLFERALAIESDDPVTLVNLSGALAATGRFAEAWLRVNQALEIAPHYQKAVELKAYLAAEAAGNVTPDPGR